MFAYACGRSLALRKQTELKLDLSDYGKPGYTRRYKLDIFRVEESIATPGEIERLKKYEPKPGRRNILHNLLCADRRKYFKERELFIYDRSILDTEKDVYLEGYWQSYKYFQDADKILAKEFSLEQEMGESAKQLLRDVEKNNSVSIHIRRGDYTNPSIPQRLLSLKYYQEAVELMKRDTSNPRFVVFSDDLEWASQNLKLPSPALYVRGVNLQDYEEMIIMSRCKHNIIANSSFSWWAAWLNNNKQKKIVAPKQWFKDPQVSSRDLLPPSWTRLEI